MNDFALYGNIIFSKSINELITYENSYLVCINNIVEGIYEELPEQFKNLKIYDYKDKLIMPGMIDLHVHAPQYAFRGIGMDYELIDWLNNEAFLEEDKYKDVDYAKKAYQIFVEDLKNSATTRASIFATRHVESTIILMDLLEKSSLVTYVGKVNMDREAPISLKEKDAEESAFSTFKWINNINNKYKNTYPIITPRFIPSCSNKLLEELREIRRAYSLPIQSHLSENKKEVEWVKILRPDALFYGDAYDIFDLFGERNEYSIGARTIMAHCVWSSEPERKRIKDNNVYVCHCPTSNINLSSGIAPIREYINDGIKIGLGSDIAGGHALSMFKVMVYAIQLSKLYWIYVNENASPLTIEEVFFLATKGGGSFFGNVGSFEKGYEFDAIVIDDSIQKHTLSLSIKQRLERAIYLSTDENGILSKFVRGKKIF